MGECSRPGEDSSELRRALLSVSYHTVGRRFDISGAPSVLLPPAIRPMSLEQALSVIATSQRGVHLDEALWRIVQGVQVATPGSAWERYPTALRGYFSRDEIEQLDERRRNFRRGSFLFVAGLTALRDPTFDNQNLMPWLSTARPENSDSDRGQPNFNKALQTLLHTDDVAFLRELCDGEGLRPAAAVQGRRPFGPADQLARLESEIGLSIQELTGNLADIVAFSQGRAQAISSDLVQVYPVATMVSQDARSLATTATVTTIVKGRFPNLVDGIEPARWQDFTDIIEESAFVDDPFALRVLPKQTGFVRDEAAGTVTAAQGPLLLRERVEIGWENSPDQRARYDNVLNIETRADGIDAADVRYTLCRSLSSSFLWDRGPGGLTLDSGFVKLRRLGQRNAYRLTMRKHVQFGDRAGRGTGPQNLSTLTNYLAPAALTSWLECQIYGIKRPAAAPQVPSQPTG